MNKQYVCVYAFIVTNLNLVRQIRTLERPVASVANSQRRYTNKQNRFQTPSRRRQKGKIPKIYWKTIRLEAIGPAHSLTFNERNSFTSEQ